MTGGMHVVIGQSESAVPFFHRALAVDPAHPHALFELANAHLSRQVRLPHCACCPSLPHTVSPCLPLSHPASHCLTLPVTVSPCLLLSHPASPCLILPHSASSYPALPPCDAAAFAGLRGCRAAFSACHRVAHGPESAHEPRAAANGALESGKRPARPGQARAPPSTCDNLPRCASPCRAAPRGAWFHGSSPRCTHLPTSSRLSPAVGLRKRRPRTSAPPLPRHPLASRTTGYLMRTKSPAGSTRRARRRTARYALFLTAILGTTISAGCCAPPSALLYARGCSTLRLCTWHARAACACGVRAWHMRRSHLARPCGVAPVLPHPAAPTLSCRSFRLRFPPLPFHLTPHL